MASPTHSRLLVPPSSPPPLTRSWSYCQDLAGCDEATPPKTCILIAFKKPAFAGQCPASATDAPAWASGVAAANPDAAAAAARAAKAYCDKERADAVKRGVVPVAVDVEVLPEAAG